MFTLRKEVKGMDADLHKAFRIVSSDIASLIKSSNDLNKRLTVLEKDKKRFTKVGPRTGKTYTTLNGRVHAIAQHLGLQFEVTPKEVVVNKAKIEAVKATKKATK